MVDMTVGIKKNNQQLQLAVGSSRGEIRIGREVVIFSERSVGESSRIHDWCKMNMYLVGGDWLP